MGLVEHYSLLDLTIEALGSTDDAQYLQNTGLIKNLAAGEGLLRKRVHLGDDYADILLVTVGDSAVPILSWLFKEISDNKNNLREKKINLKLNSAPVITKNAYECLIQIPINRMFIPDPTKQVQEIIFCRKKLFLPI